MINKVSIIPYNTASLDQNIKQWQGQKCCRRSRQVIILMKKPESNICKEVEEYNNKEVPCIILYLIPEYKR
jgi:hypothetical protein